MASTFFPGQAPRWGNESTNFYQASYTPTPGAASREKLYRCEGSQYTNCGHYHSGTKAMNQNPPLDTYGTASTRKLKPLDQTLPKALSMPVAGLSAEQRVNPYQSHQQRYNLYAMPARPPLKRSQSDSSSGKSDRLSKSLSDAFYVTSYQSDIAKYAGSSAQKSKSSEGGNTLRSTLDATQSSTGALGRPRYGRHNRIGSAPPLRPTQPQQPSLYTQAPRRPPTRRRSISGIQDMFPSRAEMIKDIFTVYPAPKPQPVNKRQGRPSSAVSLRAGKIPKLRKTEGWV